MERHGWERLFIRVTGPNGWTNNYALTIDQPVAVGNDIFDVSFVPDSLADLFLNDRVNLSFS